MTPKIYSGPVIPYCIQLDGIIYLSKEVGKKMIDMWRPDVALNDSFTSEMYKTICKKMNKNMKTPHDFLLILAHLSNRLMVSYCDHWIP